MDDLRIDAHLVIPANELTWTAVRSGGPGGQNVNKVASKVDLRFDLEGSTVLSPYTKSRVRTLARSRIGDDGVLRIVCQESRDQHQNLETARDRLVELLRAALAPPPKPRRPTKPTKGSQRRRLEGKRITSEKKQNRSGGGGWD